MKNFDLLAFGSLTLDTFVALDEMELEHHGKEEWMALPVGAKISMHTKSKHAGGSAANVTTGLAKLGFCTGVYGTVGDDESGQTICSSLKKKQVQIDGISIQKNTPSSSSIIIMTPDGERTVLHERATYSHFGHFPQGVPETRSLYIGHLEAHEESLFDHLSAWKEKGKFIFWNPGKTQFAQGVKHFKSLYPVIDILFLNTEELGLFAEKKGTIELLARTFIDAGVSFVVVTDSEKGAYSFSAEKKVFQPITDMRPAVCTLGAGDAFSVGVVAAFLGDRSAEEQLLWGTKSSESVIRKYGAQVGQITREELEG
jgi:sugar/nucleoside kinase (ribokinase family)